MNILRDLTSRCILHHQKTEQDDGSLKQDTSKTPMYLVNDYAKISMQEIRNSIHFFRIYGQRYHIPNLEWSDLFERVL